MAVAVSNDRRQLLLTSEQLDPGDLTLEFGRLLDERSAKEVALVAATAEKEVTLRSELAAINNDIELVRARLNRAMQNT